MYIWKDFQKLNPGDKFRNIRGHECVVLEFKKNGHKCYAEIDTGKIFAVRGTMAVAVKYECQWVFLRFVVVE